jgi:hypothetical protein
LAGVSSVARNNIYGSITPIFSTLDSLDQPGPLIAYTSFFWTPIVCLLGSHRNMPYLLKNYILFFRLYCLPLSFYEKQLELKADELISKTVKINEANRALAVANQRLESKK